jgi:hypothetical protein
LNRGDAEKTKAQRVQMTEQKSWIGGARLDIFNATWPFATLTAIPGGLTLKVKFWGTIFFQASQIKKIEPVRYIPLIGKGIQVHHSLDPLANPTEVIFWCFGNPEKLIVEIRKLMEVEKSRD